MVKLNTELLRRTGDDLAIRAADEIDSLRRQLAQQARDAARDVFNLVPSERDHYGADLEEV